jgi:hypothetical protein
MADQVHEDVSRPDLGYARVELRETIARGDSECRVVVRFRPTTADVEGREYDRAPASA